MTTSIFPPFFGNFSSKKSFRGKICERLEISLKFQLDLKGREKFKIEINSNFLEQELIKVFLKTIKSERGETLKSCIIANDILCDKVDKRNTFL